MHFQEVIKTSGTALIFGMQMAFTLRITSTTSFRLLLLIFPLSRFQAPCITTSSMMSHKMDQSRVSPYHQQSTLGSYGYLPDTMYTTASHTTSSQGSKHLINNMLSKVTFNLPSRFKSGNVTSCNLYLRFIFVGLLLAITTMWNTYTVPPTSQLGILHLLLCVTASFFLLCIGWSGLPQRRRGMVCSCGEV